jgi:hypothetical protein
MLFDFVEHHPNPVGLFNEVVRILSPGGIVIVVSKRARPGVESPHDREHRYEFFQLATQMLLTGAFKALINGKQDDPTRDILIAMQRLPREQWLRKGSPAKLEPMVQEPQREPAGVA